MSSLVVIAPEVREALQERRAVVALETTLVSHGFPAGEGAAVGRESERRVRAAGAIPATVGILDGTLRIGLSDDELQRFDEAGGEARKVGPRDLGTTIAQRALGATTVGGTLAAIRVAGIRFMGTGGLGGVHRGFPAPPDVSADLGELARAQAVVVSSGVKSLLDVPATMEVLETLGVPGRHSALVLARPPEDSLDDVEPLIEEALAAAGREDVRGQAVTPFVLSYLHEHSGGRTAAANKELVAANASLAAEVAVAFAQL